MWDSSLIKWVPLWIGVIVQVADAQVTCPWDNPELELWSDGATWPSGEIPQFNDSVVIPHDKKILLDTPIPRLLTLTIDGTLVWGNVDGIRIEASYVLINGEFHIGSEECYFEKKADIFLYGTSLDAQEHPSFGKKFIGGSNGSIIEMHGQAKKSWTKLTGTVTPNNGSCGFVYDSWDEKFDDEYEDGLRVVIWNPDGTVIDYGVFDTTSSLQEIVEDFAYKIGNLTSMGKIIAIAVRDTIGQPQASWEPLYQAIESLGGKDIRNVQDRDPYVLVAVTGHPSTAREMRVERIPIDDLLTARASVTIEARNLVFRAESATVATSGSHYTRFRVLTRKLAFPLVTVLDDVTSWHAGDQVVVASTDFDWRQAEVKTIAECIDCTKNQFRVDGEFKYRHFGHVTYGIDQRAEIGLLTRNIRIEAEIQDECYSYNDEEEMLCSRFGYDTFGGHTRVDMGSFARVEGVELYHMGQHYVGKYPWHYHLCDEAHGLYFRNNTVRDSFSRCITIHGTDYTEVSDNVCLNHLGHGIFLEDSAERWNTIHRNLVIGTMHGMILMSDKRHEDCGEFDPDFCNLLSSFWISRPENYITDNVAAGSDFNGIVMAFADKPLGPSLARQIERGLYRKDSAQYIPVAAFSGNIMHSSHEYGLWFDSRISFGQYHKSDFVPENGVIRTNLFYDPRDPPNENGTKTDTILSHLTFYKNNELDTWMRCGNIVITNSSYADTTTAISTGRSTTESSCDIRHSIFIGETENRGEPFLYINSSTVYDHLADEDKPRHLFDRSFSRNIPDAIQSAILMYQGPMYVDNCYFDRYFNWYYNDSFVDTWGFRPVHASAALSFHRSNPYPLVPRTGTFNLKFGNCDGVNDAFRVVNGNETTPHWKMKDGTTMTTFRDYDGSITGIAGTQIVPDRSFFTGPECLSKPEWDMSICPYKYAQLVVRGEGGVLVSSLREEWAVLVTRDDSLDDVINMEGTHGLKYPVQIHKSYTIRFNASLGGSPTELEIKAKYGLERNDIIRIAICLPKTTTSFKIVSSWPKINSKTSFPNWVNSLAEVDADTTMTAFFWDQTNGYLYFKMSSNETFTNFDHNAAGDLIPEVTITRLDGDNNPAICTMDNPPYSNPQVTPPQPVTEASCSGPDSPKGLGAHVIKDFTHPDPPEETCADCPVTDKKFTVRPSEVRGCFAQKDYLNDFSEDVTQLKRAMTQELCIDKCFHRDFPLAGLYSGSKCECTNFVGRNGVNDPSLCDRECTGDASQICGGGWREVLVFTTGAAMPPPPARCGPSNRGVYYQGKCINLNYLEVDFWTAELVCQAQGGTLSKIDTEEKMRFIETYLLNVDLDVWFGAQAGVDNWYFLDGTALTYGNWKKNYLPPETDMFLYLQQKNQYRWNTDPYDDYKLALCDISVDTSSADISGDCGYRLQGTKFGPSDRCFLRIEELLSFQDAAFICKRKFGRMVSILDVDEQADIESFLQGINDTERYWVNGNPNNAGNQKAYDREIPRSLIEKSDDRHYRTVCVLDKEDTEGCFTGWTKNGSSCYIDTQLVATSYSQAAALCNSGATSILTVDGQSESDFLQNWILGTTWLDLRYNGVLDDTVKSNGETTSFSLWSTSDYLQTLSQGLCVAMDVDSETWLHTPCSGGIGHKVVCEAPLTFL